MHRRQPTSILGSYFERFKKVGLKDAFRLAVGVAIFGVATAVLLHTAEHTPGPQAQTFLQWSLGCLASSKDAITYILPFCPTKNELVCGHVLIHPVGEHVELLDLFYASSSTDFLSFIKGRSGVAVGSHHSDNHKQSSAGEVRCEQPGEADWHHHRRLDRICLLSGDQYAE